MTTGPYGPLSVEDFIDRYAAWVEARTAVVLAGAGVSHDAKFPAWGPLVQPFARQIGLSKKAMGTDYPFVVEAYTQHAPSGGQSLLDALVKKMRSVRNPQPTELHRLLAELPIDEYWTTNYDTLLDEAVNGTTVRSDDQLAGLSGGGRRVLKMHGHITLDGRAVEPPLGIVLSRSDYENYARTHPRFWHLLQAQFLTRNFLFVGFSFNDPNLLHVLRIVRDYAPDQHREHFVFLTAPDNRYEELRRSDLARTGVHTVELSVHSELPDVLRRLIARCRPARLLIIGSSTDHPTVTGPGTYATAPLDPALRATAEALGVRLAATPTRLVTSGPLGGAIGYAMMNILQSEDRYDANRLSVVRRVKAARLENDDPLTTRFGSMVFTAEGTDDLRDRALHDVRAVLVIGGGTGTRNEVERASEAGHDIIGLPSAGGVGREIWTEMNANLGSYRLGNQAIDPALFARLNDTDQAAALAAVTELIGIALGHGRPGPKS
jgi:SIR2-like domain